MRATWSTEPPGGNTATSLIGCLVGQACAQAARGAAKVHTAASASAARKVEGFMGISREKSLKSRGTKYGLSPVFSHDGLYQWGLRESPVNKPGN
jgi:hypothetical protein